MRAEIRVNKLHCVSYASLKPNEYFYAFVKITTQCPSMKMRLIFIRNEVVSLMGNTDRTYLSFTSRIFPNRVYESPDFWRTCSFIFLSRFVPFRQRDPAAISFLFFFFLPPPVQIERILARARVRRLAIARVSDVARKTFKMAETAEAFGTHLSKQTNVFQPWPTWRWGQGPRCYSRRSNLSFLPSY